MRLVTFLLVCSGVLMLTGQSCKSPLPVEQKPDSSQTTTTGQQDSQDTLPDIENKNTSTRPTNVTTPDTKPTTTQQIPTPVVKPTTKPSVTPQYDAAGFPLRPTNMQKFVHSNGETYYYVDGQWTLEDYVYPYQNQNNSVSSPGDNPAADPDSLNYSNTVTDPNACSPEGASYHANDTTYYCIDGIWTMSDYAYPYQNY